VVLAIVVAAQFMFGVDAFVVNVAIPTIAIALHASPAQIEALTGSLLSRGVLCDRSRAIGPAGAVRCIGTVCVVDCDRRRILVMDAPRAAMRVATICQKRLGQNSP
jgi:hypothetical protein